MNNMYDELNMDLNWKVEKRLMIAVGYQNTIPDKKAVIRIDPNGRLHYLGVVGHNYQLWQNSELLDFCSCLCEEGDLEILSSGYTGKGEQVFVICRYKDDIAITKGDVIVKQLIVTNTHNMSGSIRVFRTNVRVNCLNMLANLYRQSPSKVSIRHTTNMKARLDVVAEVLKRADSHFSELTNIYHGLYCKEVNPGMLESIWQCVFEPSNPEGDHWKNRVGVLRDCLMEETIGAGLNAWEVYNGITRYTTHEMRSSLKSLVDGHGAKINNKALEILEGLH